MCICMGACVYDLLIHNSAFSISKIKIRDRDAILDSKEIFIVHISIDSSTTWPFTQPSCIAKLLS